MAGEVAGTYEDFLNNQALQQRLAETGGLPSIIAPTVAKLGISDNSDYVPGVTMDFSNINDPNTLASFLQSVPQVLIGATPTIASEVAQGFCALFPSLCSGSSSLQSKAPNAGLLTGSCPPGRVVRHISFGRDKCVKKARMNPLNPKALNRAVRRLSGFQHFAVRTEKAIQHSFRKAGVAPRRRISSGRCTTCSKKSCGGC